ncbi:MarC family protein [Bradyrhizobium brasilense]|uniref:MarC family protein n=1 Tax=Bradyrhizobium brasilense TaxID=1419277 RepID=UPI0015A06DB0|nr:MarC family protein [Bradyrhizobium brasilense]
MKRLVAIVVAALVPVAAAAQSTGVLSTKHPLTWGMIFALLFLMLGPIKLLGAFAAATKDRDHKFRRQLATRAFLFSIAAVTIAAGIGDQILENFAFPVLVLQIAAGIILSLVALQAILPQYNPASSEPTEPLTLALGFSPLAFPTIVTPYGGCHIIARPEASRPMVSSCSLRRPNSVRTHSSPCSPKARSAATSCAPPNANCA